MLRLLRFFRFYAHYGRPPPDPDALYACREWAQKIETLSGERVRVEIFRTLMATDPADAFELMRDWRVLAHVLPEADDVGRLKMLSWLDSRALRIDTVAAGSAAPAGGPARRPTRPRSSASPSGSSCRTARGTGWRR